MLDDTEVVVWKNQVSVSVMVHCFDGDRYQGSDEGYITEGRLDPGATGTFSVELYEHCASFLVSATGS